jgi:hypothetical protein
MTYNSCCPGGFSYPRTQTPTASAPPSPSQAVGTASSKKTSNPVSSSTSIHNHIPYQHPNLQSLPSSLIAYTFDLVLLEGHPLCTAEPDRLASLNNISDRLLISQLIIGVQSVCPFGSWNNRDRALETRKANHRQDPRHPRLDLM